MEEEYEIQWWNDYYTSDTLERLKLVENLPFVREVIGISKIEDEKFSEEYKIHSIATMLNSFFEDFESYMYERNKRMRNDDFQKYLDKKLKDLDDKIKTINEKIDKNNLDIEAIKEKIK